MVILLKTYFHFIFLPGLFYGLNMHKTKQHKHLVYSLPFYVSLNIHVCSTDLMFCYIMDCILPFVNARVKAMQRSWTKLQICKTKNKEAWFYLLLLLIQQWSVIDNLMPEPIMTQFTGAYMLHQNSMRSYNRSVHNSLYHHIITWCGFQHMGWDIFDPDLVYLHHTQGRNLKCCIYVLESHTLHISYRFSVGITQ